MQTNIYQVSQAIQKGNLVQYFSVVSVGLRFQVVNILNCLGGRQLSEWSRNSLILQ